MQLTHFIRSNMSAILDEFVEYARTIPSGARLDSAALQNSTAHLLNAIADDMDTEQSGEDQREKSKGRRPDNSPPLSRYAQDHAASRLQQGFTVEQMVSEYRVLRATVIRLWADENKSGGVQATDIVRFSEAVDQGLTAALLWYGQRISDARDMFLGILGHDLRNPLGAVVMSAHLILLDTSLNAESTSAAVRVLNSGKRMQRMIEDLLDFVSGRFGRAILIHPTSISLGPVLRQAVDELRALHPTVRISHDTEGDLTGHWDAGRLGQLFSNIGGNAIQHGDPTQPITIIAVGTGSEVVITAHNHGEPIPANMLETIFDPMRRGEASDRMLTAGHSVGLGLGLYISKEIAEAHGGTIAVTSSKEDGTVFTLTLPRKAIPGGMTERRRTQGWPHWGN